MYCVTVLSPEELTSFKVPLFTAYESSFGLTVTVTDVLSSLTDADSTQSGSSPMVTLSAFVDIFDVKEPPVPSYASSRGETICHQSNIQYSHIHSLLFVLHLDLDHFGKVVASRHI